MSASEEHIPEKGHICPVSEIRQAIVWIDLAKKYISERKHPYKPALEYLDEAGKILGGLLCQES